MRSWNLQCDSGFDCDSGATQLSENSLLKVWWLWNVSNVEVCSIAARWEPIVDWKENKTLWTNVQPWSSLQEFHAFISQFMLALRFEIKCVLNRIWDADTDLFSFLGFYGGTVHSRFYLLVLLTNIVLHLFFFILQKHFVRSILYVSMWWVSRANQRSFFIFYIVHLHLKVLHCDFVLQCSIMTKEK